MSIIKINNIKPKKMFIYGSKAKYAYCLGKKVWSADSILLNTGDNMSSDAYRWYIPGDLEGAQTGDSCYPTVTTSIDCTGYNYCKVRVYAHDTGVTNSGNAVNHFWVYLGFTTYYPNATIIAHKNTVYDADGNLISSSGDGAAYNTWVDIVIDVSKLNGNQRLNCIGHRDCYTGRGYFNVWISKITMYN